VEEEFSEVRTIPIHSLSLFSNPLAILRLFGAGRLCPTLSFVRRGQAKEEHIAMNRR
jgi:hypothetical protein